jgi:hypothetical protein
MTVWWYATSHNGAVFHESAECKKIGATTTAKQLMPRGILGPGCKVQVHGGYASGQERSAHGIYIHE